MNLKINDLFNLYLIFEFHFLYIYKTIGLTIYIFLILTILLIVISIYQIKLLRNFFLLILLLDFIVNYY